MARHRLHARLRRELRSASGSAGDAEAVGLASVKGPLSDK